MVEGILVVNLRRLAVSLGSGYSNESSSSSRFSFIGFSGTWDGALDTTLLA